MQNPEIKMNDKLSDHKIYLLAALGSGIEYYDFSIFIFLTGILGAVFFPAQNPFISTILSYSVLAIGTLGRLFGGILFSHIGDRYGRKSSFLYTIICMTIPSFIITFLPVYASLGLLSTFLLIFLRLIQGFAVGGEIPGAATLIYESVAPKNQTFACAVLLAGNFLGLLFASCVQYFLNLFLSVNQVTAFGWRIPFFVGGLLGIIGIFIRKKLKESPVFLSLKKDHKIVQNPLADLFKNNFSNLILSVFISSFAICFGLIFFSFLPSYLSSNFHYTLADVLKINSYALIISIISIVSFGLLTKKYDKYNMFKLSCLFFLIITYPIFLLFASQNIIFLSVGYFLGAIFSGMTLAPFYSIMNDIFPPQIRYTGFAISLALTTILFGSGGAALCTYVVQKTNFSLFPAVFMLICCLLSLSSVSVWHKNSRFKRNFS